MPSHDLDELMAKLNQADRTGDKEETKSIRRYIAKKYGADAYRDPRTMEWKIAIATPFDLPEGDDKTKKPEPEKTPSNLLDAARRALGMDKKEHEEMAKREKEARFREMYGGKPERSEYDREFQGYRDVFEREAQRRADEHHREHMREAAKWQQQFESGGKGDYDKLDQATKDAIKRGDFKVPDPAVREEARRRMREFRGSPNWDTPPDWNPQPSEPPPPELPPDVHTPSIEETMAAINENFNEETS